MTKIVASLRSIDGKKGSRPLGRTLTLAQNDHQMSTKKAFSQRRIVPVNKKNKENNDDKN
jgi:hypothetical protein